MISSNTLASPVATTSYHLQHLRRKQTDRTTWSHLMLLRHRALTCLPFMPTQTASANTIFSANSVNRIVKTSSVSKSHKKLHTRQLSIWNHPFKNHNAQIMADKWKLPRFFFLPLRVRWWIRKHRSEQPISCEFGYATILCEILSSKSITRWSQSYVWNSQQIQTVSGNPDLHKRNRNWSKLVNNEWETEKTIYSSLLQTLKLP
jgi:hypothetical protein